MPCEMTGRHLERGQGAHIQGAQYCQRAIAERELCLPDRQQHVNHVGETIVQSVRKTGEHESALAGPSCHVSTGRWNDSQLLQPQLLSVR